ncbi:hypothetical protein [Streptomyces sp. cg35]|uniref:hypothetical protein n=1 Tax=Streptomyces sp. cg35 TaxID=3421650 RepID=UPI003D16744D
MRRLVEAVLFAVLYRRGGRDAVRSVLPAAARRLVGHELRVLASFGLWLTGRRSGVPAGASSFAYARGQATMMYAFAFVGVVESVGMSVLLRDWPTLHRIVLALDVYTVVMVLGLHAAAVTRPHVVTADALRVRRGAHVDLRIPLERIAAVRRENRYTHTPAEGELNLDVASQTSVTVELTEPVRHFTFLGRPKDVRLVRLHAEEPDLLAGALRAALTRERTAPSPAPGRPA